MAGAEKRWLHVVAAVISRVDGDILIARRPPHKHQGDLWEFPGGKVEPGEAPRDALARELWEELHITVRAAEPWLEVRHDYPDKAVFLDVWRVSAFEGKPVGREGQPLVWVSPAQLRGYAFPEANVPILDALLG